MNIKPIYLIFGLLAACTMGPDFKPPQLPAPASWFRASISPASSQPVEAPLDTKWWSVLKDAELDQLVARVAKENLDVLAASERIGESRAERGIVAADLFPQIHGDASYTREKLSDKGIIGLISGSSGNASRAAMSQPNGVPSTQPIPPFNIYQYGFDASWEIDLWGKTRRGVEAANATLKASEDARRGAELSAIAELVSNYVQLRATQAERSIVEENLAAARTVAGLVKSRAAAGLSSTVDLANATAQAASTEAQVPPLRQQQAQLENAIALLLGQPPGALEGELSSANPLPPLPPAVPIGVPSELALRRPDIREAEADLHAATAQIGVAKANFFPDLTLSGNGMLQALNFSDLNTWAARTYMFGPSLVAPIFEGGRLTSTLKLRNAQEREAFVTYRKTVLSAFHEVDNALTAFRSEQEREKSLNVTVLENQKALGLATNRYENGLGDFIDVLTAERSLLDSRLQAVQSTQAETLNMVQLYKALGGGWQTDFPEKKQSKSNMFTVF